MPELVVNGGRYELEAAVGTSLASALRDRIGLTGTKISCNEGHCGACTVLVDGRPTLSCITLLHRVAGEVTTIEGLRDHPMVASFVRADAVQCGYCTPGQIVSAVALVESDPAPQPRGDPPPHGREHLPLRHLSEDRGGDPHVARLIRTEKEVEGRFEDVWLVVEEDALEQWPDGPRRGRRPAGTACRRAGARARRGALHLRRTAARDAARRRAALAACTGEGDARSTSARRSPRPGCAVRSGRATAERAHGHVRLRGAGGRGRLRRHPRPGAGGAGADRRRVGGCSRPSSTPTMPSSAAKPLTSARTSAATSTRGLAEADVIGRGDLPHPDRAPQLDGDPQLGLPLGRRLARGPHLDAVHLGRPLGARRGLRHRAGQGAA